MQSRREPALPAALLSGGVWASFRHLPRNGSGEEPQQSLGQPGKGTESPWPLSRAQNQGSKMEGCGLGNVAWGTQPLQGVWAPAWTEA